MNNNYPVSPEHRICGKLTNWERDAPNLAHFANRVGDESLIEEIARLQAQINRTLKKARLAAAKSEAQE